MLTEENRLNLAHLNLTEVPESLISDYQHFVKIIDVTNNQIRDVSFLKSFTNLTCIILDHNLIPASVIFPTSHSVTTLWMNYNRIDELYPFVKNLKTSFPNLKHLSLMGNSIAPPCTEDTYYDYIQYRLYVLSCLSDLEHLDDRVTTDYEKEEATRLYGRSHLSTPTLPNSVTSFLNNALEKMVSFWDPVPVTGRRANRARVI